MRFLAAIGALAIVVGIGAAAFFFGGYYNVAGTAADPAPVTWALTQVRVASINRHANDRPPASFGDAAMVQAGAKAYSAFGCATCHAFEYRVWLAGPHAKAHEALSAEQLADPKCNTCHTMAPGDSNTRLLGVQCERCHGGGRYYQADYVMRDKELARAVGLIDPTPVHCQQCHTEGAPSIRPFDFQRMWALIDHGKAAREAAEKAQGKDAKAEK